MISNKLIPVCCKLIAAKCVNKLSSIATSFSVAPFCGPKTAAAPSAPIKVLVTSQRILILQLINLLSSVVVSTKANSFNCCGRMVSSTPAAFKNLAPKARKIPVPPSTVAEPPMVKIIFLTPLFKAACISWPVPKELAVNGLYSLWDKRFKPEASAISINPIVPS